MTRRAILPIILLMLFCNQLAFASFEKNMWSKWVVHNPLSTASISHQAWQAFLDAHVTTNAEGINILDYPHFNEETEEKLAQYIDYLVKIDIKNYNRNEQLAYWINLYNALVVQLIAQHYPISTIHEINISPGIFNPGPWRASSVTIQGLRLSLEEIQNSIIRPIWNDPRIHYALNNASIGAANLSKKAYLGSTINEQLNQAATVYINSLRGVQVIDNKLIASKIYKWYLADFGETEEDIIFHLTQYAREPLKSQLTSLHSIHSYIYNWHLNSAAQS